MKSHGDSELHWQTPREIDKNEMVFAVDLNV